MYFTDKIIIYIYIYKVHYESNTHYFGYFMDTTIHRSALEPVEKCDRGSARSNHKRKIYLCS